VTDQKGVLTLSKTTSTAVSFENLIKLFNWAVYKKKASILMVKPFIRPVTKPEEEKQKFAHWQTRLKFLTMFYDQTMLTFTTYDIIATGITTNILPRPTHFNYFSCTLFIRRLGKRRIKNQ
jgi:hypothetical protein